MSSADEHDHRGNQDRRTVGYSAIPARADRDALNAALFANGAETGFWDDQGRPAPWPDDIDQWRPETGERAIHESRQEPI
jgi:hypothetical protein